MTDDPAKVIAGDMVDEEAAQAASDLDDRRGRLVRGWIVPSIVGTALLMSSLNSSSVTTALPAMARDLAVEPLRLNIVITAYLLALVVFLPVSGWLADRFGAKQILMTAILLFAVASAACGLAQTLPQLIAARLVQGCAGAMIAPVGRLILLRSTPRHELVGALSALTMPSQFGPLAGPLLGGAVVSFLSWHWIFYLNLPVALAAILLVRAFVPDVPARAVTPIDWRGILLTGGGMGALIYALDNLMRDDVPAGLLTACLVAATMCLALYWRHACGRSDAVVDLTLFRVRSFRAAVVGGAFFRLIPGATPFLLAMLLQVAFGMSAFQAGLMTFMTAVGSLMMKAVAPPILRRLGFRRVLLVNGAVTAAIFMAYALFTPATPHGLIMLALAVGGFFRALQFTSTSGLAFADMTDAQMGRATTSSAMVQQLVQSVSTALAAAVLYVLMTARGVDALDAATVAPSFAIVGALSLVSLLWFVRLPDDAGSSMTGGTR
ncbi:MAG: MFS transporter [Sphingomonas sp.]|uniref:MFS transporter n=1 Tax=Sphingomonas sp. TaxID=28214 RepID=UPI0022739B8C|nr:MFS transporter [Sphingomonas sp.]MCX8477833.1 MFS transporter [Sphingomonas sp.]